MVTMEQTDAENASRKGTLYLVATPIGNLSDVSQRSRETLSRVNLIACEDTRVTRKLLAWLEIKTRTQSYHEHNESVQTPKLLRILSSGKDIALVTDAGTPSVSDPGLRLVRAAHEQRIPVRAIPGPTAAISALVLSGLPAHRFTFIGFLPSKGTARRKAIASLSDEKHTMILFEAVPRLEKLLRELSAQLGAREGFVAREMTKKFEEHRVGNLDALAEWAGELGRRLKGEVTLVVAPEPTTSHRTRDDTESLGSVSDLESRYRVLTERGMSRREAVKTIAKETGLKTRSVYQRLLPEQS